MIRFPIVDTHVHLMDPARFAYRWTAQIPYLNRPFLLSDYNAACGPVKVDTIVFMECGCDRSKTSEEVAWVTELAAVDKRIKGIVASAPLEKGEGARAEVAALAQNPLVKGIRRDIQAEGDPDFCLRPDFIKGVRLLAEYNLSFDICVSYHQMAAAARFAEQCPGVRMILDHIGKPDIKGHAKEPWMTELGRLAALPNVWCKVSSLATEADHESWTLDDLKPYVDRVFECFGFDRTVFAGDWPVSSLAAHYPVCVETLERLVDQASETQLRRLFRENGRAFYRL